MLFFGLFPSLLFLSGATASTISIQPQPFLSVCSSDNQCPAQASCCARYHDRPLCICNEGFVESFNFADCEKAVYLTESCITRCAGLSTICDVDSKLCVCSTGYVAAADGKNCVIPGMGLLGEACGSGCALGNEQVCVDEVCSCKEGFRPMTKEEIRASINPQRQCIDKAYVPDGSAVLTSITTKKQTSPGPLRTTFPTTVTITTETTIPPTVASTTPAGEKSSTEGPALCGSSIPFSQISDENQTQPPDDTLAGDTASHSTGMRTGMAVGVSLAILVTLIALGVVVVVRKRKTKKDYNNCSESGLGTKNKNPKGRGTGLRDSSYVTESTIDGERGNSLSSQATGTLPDVLVHSTETRSSTGHLNNGGHVTDGQDGTDADDVRLPDGKMGGAKLPSRQDHSVVYSNFKIKENKAKKVVTTKAQAEASRPDDTTYNTLSIANVKSRGDQSNHKEDYNTLYNMKV